MIKKKLLLGTSSHGGKAVVEMSQHKKYIVSIPKLRKVLSSVFLKIGFNITECESLIYNIVTAEMAQKYSHGIARAIWIVENIASGKHDFGPRKKMRFRICSNYLHVDAKKRVGPFAIDSALHVAFLRLRQNNFHSFSCGITNIGPYSGFISAYALQAMKEGYIFLSFIDSPSGLVPYGCQHELWGTNPITLGFPDAENPFLIDFSSAETTWGDHYLSLLLGDKTQENFETQPIAGPKGSALAFLVKLIAGMMTREKQLSLHSRTSGVFFFLIKQDPFTTAKTTSVVIETVKTQLFQARSKGNIARFPGEKTMLHIDLAKKNNAIFTYQSIWEKLQTIEKTL